MQNSDRRKQSGRLLVYSGRKFAHVKNELISPPAASDSSVERHRDAIFRPRELALGNNRHDLCKYFEGTSIFSVASVTPELYEHIRFTLFCITFVSQREK